MQTLVRAALGLLTGFALIECWATRTVLKAGKSLIRRLYNLRGIVQYKSLGSLKLLREVSGLLDSLGVRNFIAGGFAYDIAQGKMTRYHGDLDIAILVENDMQRVLDCLLRHGFQIHDHETWWHVAKHARKIDLFCFRPSKDGYIINRYKTTCVRIPDCYFTYKTKSFWGHTYKISSPEYNLCIEPFVQKKASLDYIKQIRCETPIACRRRIEQIAETATVYEFFCADEETPDILQMPYRAKAA